MRALRVLLALLTLVCVAAGSNAEIPIPRSPAHWATDTAGFLKPQTVTDLDARLRAYEAQTGHQVLVYVAPTTGATPTEDWTVGAFARWKVGRKGLDDGLILFVFPSDRKVRIEVGYGLEQRVPDAIAARIIRDTITPKIRAGQPDEGVVAGTEALIGAISGTSGGSGTVPHSTPVPDANADQLSDLLGNIVATVLGVLIFGVLAWFLISAVRSTPRGRGRYVRSGFNGWALTGEILGGIAGGIGSGGGGFSGGGGMSGGGGATGSW